MRKEMRNAYNKRIAYAEVAAAKRAGELTPKGVCSKCGSTWHTALHHEDYAKPLDVIELCSVCHAIAHDPSPKRHQIQLKVNGETKKKFKKKMEEDGYEKMSVAIGDATEEKFGINLNK